MPFYSFSPGPAPLPKSVLKALHEELLNTFGTGESILEVSHRSKAYTALNDETLDLCRKVLEIPATHFPVLTPFGAQHLFSLIPCQLSVPGDRVCYGRTGIWASLALQEAQRIGRQVDVVFDGGPDFHSLGQETDWKRCPPGAVYCHLTVNNTVYGLEFPQNQIPKTGSCPLVLDMTSALGARTDTPWPQVAVVYGSFQKNLGIAGASIVILREDILKNCETYGARNFLGQSLTFSAIEAARSALNTPPVFALFVFNKMLKWLENQGGLKASEERALAKSALIYKTIDEGFYKGRANTLHRSRHNIVFHLPETRLDDLFLKEAQESGIIEIKGYRNVGGVRVSIYNGVDDTAAHVLKDFMVTFRKRYG